MAVTPLLLADSVGKSYGSRKVLSAASLAVQPGSVTVMLGRNGAGKSTLLKIAAGWIAADHGIVRFRGETYTRPRLHHLAAQGLYYLPTHPSLSPAFSVREHLHAVQRRFGTPDPAPVIERLQIAPLLDRTPDTLSGGERRRTEVAVALLRRPLCLLADEPLHGIAPRDMEVIGEALRELARGGCGVVATGHEVPSLLALADQVVWVTAGTSYALGSPAEAARDARFRREYLGVAEIEADTPRAPAPATDNGAAAPPPRPPVEPRLMKIDAQTLRDLEIFETADAGRSVFDLLNHTRTSGGRSKLVQRFRNPLAGAEEIAEVQAALRFILAQPQLFAAIDEQQIREVGKYLGSNFAPITSSNPVTAAAESRWYQLRHPDEFTAIRAGVERTLEFLRGLQSLRANVAAAQPPAPLAAITGRIGELMARGEVERLHLNRTVHDRSPGDILLQDRLLREELRVPVREAIEQVYELDALLSMATATRKHGLVFPELLASPAPQVEIDSVYHLFVERARPNDLRLDAEERLLFLTGPNMAGKTTYLKACALAVYLAHLGMGVPAARMRTSAFELLFSSITTTDNVRLGYSYFYSEVRRVREIAQLLREGRRSFV
ncbi:MAG TPA: ATP-binding cassette domain-containing protein, partial [Longimicrobiaceae bacterium]|nr:ATP-binding cassette domain-containing protein [Longimicrobiaceae bacterium]